MTIAFGASAPQANQLPSVHTRPIAPPIYKKPTLTTEQAAKLLIKEKIRDRHLDGTTKVLYEFFSLSQPRSMPFHTPGEFNNNQKDQTRRAIQAWEDLANIAFEEIPESSLTEDAEVLMGKHSHNDHRIVFGQVPNWTDSGFHTSEYTTERHSSHVMVGMAAEAPDFNHENFKRGTLTRLIGNAIGLGTPLQIKTKNPSPGDSAFHDKDNRDYTLMSPHRGKNSHITRQSIESELTPGKYYEYEREENRPAAAMMHDIAAVQKMYGANLKTRNTDTVYGFNSNTDRDFLSLNAATDKALFCVWDAGGNDTLDFSGFSQNQKINLYERSFSDVGGMKGNVSIAKGVTLENAVGGSGDDLLIGNHVDNRLKGGAGADTLEGGNGADTFVYDNASDSTPDKPDLITDFSSGTDKIDLSGLLRNSRISGLNYVNDFTGKAGDAVLGYDPNTGHGSLSVDLTGNGKPDLLINTVGQIQPNDVLVSTLQKAPMHATTVQGTPQILSTARTAQTTRSNAAPTMHYLQNNIERLFRSPKSASAAENKNVAYMAVPNHSQNPADGVRSQLPDTASPIAIVSLKNGNWNYYVNLPKNPKDNDLVIINSTASTPSKIVDPGTGGRLYWDIKNRDKLAFKYSAQTKTWSPQNRGDDSRWLGKKILLGTSKSVVSLDSRNWRPDARLPLDGVDGDTIRLHSDAELPIDIKTPNLNDPTVWQMRKGDSVDFRYNATNGAWELHRTPGQFHRAQTLIEGVLPPLAFDRTYVEVGNGNWQESITLPGKDVREGQRVIVKTTADHSFKVKAGRASYTIGSGETASFKANSNGQFIRESEPANYYTRLYMRDKLKLFNLDGIWPSW